jgi:GH15 family glucan-1,4-alpha-glucosidase
VEVDWLPGYEGSKPVRIGNGASGQFQLDVFGEVADAALTGVEAGLRPHRDLPAHHPEASELLPAMMEHLERVWQLPDDGIWEIRGPQRHFVQSKVMAWVAFDRAVKIVAHTGRQGMPTDRWQEIADQIKAEVCDKGFNKEKNCFVQYYGSDQLDSSLLMLARVGFLPPSDPRIVGTVEAIERELLVDGFVRRYHTHNVDDGLRPGEGAFLACSFWLADAYISIGRLADAEKLFKGLLAVRNDLGLLSEEYEPHLKRLQGNFPQAFSHVALINTAFNLTRAEKPQEQRADGQGMDKSSKGDAKNVAGPPVVSRPEPSSRVR